jgi:hypothetical protein
MFLFLPFLFNAIHLYNKNNNIKHPLIRNREYIYRERGVAKIPKDYLMGYSPKERLVQIMYVSVKMGRCSSWALMHVCTSTGR